MNNIPPNTEFNYSLKTFNYLGSSISNNGTCKTRPGSIYYFILVPTIENITIEQCNCFLNISWNSNDLDISNYTLYKNGIYFNTVNATNIIDCLTEINRDIEYCVTAYNGYETSERKCATIKAPPSLPDEITSNEFYISRSDDSVILSILPNWNGGVNNRTIKVYYKIESYEGYNLQEFNFDITNIYTLNIISTEVYDFRVSACNECNECETEHEECTCINCGCSILSSIFKSYPTCIIIYF